MTCGETDMETPTTSKDTTRKLVCNIQGGAGSTVQISHLHEGLKLGLEGSLEKFSEVLGRNAVSERASRFMGRGREGRHDVSCCPPRLHLSGME